MSLEYSLLLSELRLNILWAITELSLVFWMQHQEAPSFPKLPTTKVIKSIYFQTKNFITSRSVIKTATVVTELQAKAIPVVSKFLGAKALGVD